MRQRTWLAYGTLLLLGLVVSAQSPSYRVVPGWPNLPDGWRFGQEVSEPNAVAGVAGVAVDKAGYVYVAHRGEHPLIKFTSEGKYVTNWGDKDLSPRPHMLEFDGEGHLWVADEGNHRLLKLNEKFEILMTLGTAGEPGEDATHFNRPTDVAFTSKGDILISDGYGNNRVVKFTHDGKFIKAWGKKGEGEGEFQLPHSIAVDAEDRVYVADRTNKRLQVFDAEGTFLTQWRHVGTPWGVTVSDDGYVFIADGAEQKVRKVTTKGDVVAVWSEPGHAPGQLDWAHGIAVDGAGAVYVTDIIGQRVQKFVTSLSPLPPLPSL